MRPPSGSIMGLEGGLFSRYLRIMTTHGRPLAPITGAGGRPFVPAKCDGTCCSSLRDAVRELAQVLADVPIARRNLL